MSTEAIQPTTATASGQLRRRLTIACETCRKRKARCSGIAPCVLCRKNSLHCEFNYDRQRRGPRPRPRDIGPTDTSTDYSNSPMNNSVDNAASTGTRELLKAKTLPGKPLNSEKPEVHEPEARESAPESTKNIWRDAVRRLLDDDEILPGESTPSLGLVLHLLEVFRSHGNYQAWIFDFDSLSSRLLENRVSAALIYAICAVSVIFSRHPSVISKSGQIIRRRLASFARRRMMIAPEPSACLDRIQALCVLALNEVSDANGKQAWCDINTAHSLMQLAISTDMLLEDEQVPANLALHYLYVTERELCLGHNLSPSISIDHLSKTAEEDRSCSILLSPQLTEILDLLLAISTFSRTPHPLNDLNPSSIDSEVMSFRQALDKYIICHQEELQFDPAGLREGFEESRRQLQSMQCSLAYHCCLILLNRIYLPVPKIQNESNVSPMTQDLPQKNVQEFPLAFGPALQERVKACETSASIICGVCQDVMSCEVFLFPSFMGYCCFQSSIVLINQLRRSRGSDSKVIEDLKISFTILGAMRTFYIPAQQWIDTLFDLHQPESHLETAIPSLDNLFSTYFARFKAVKEPPYVPIEKPESQDIHSLSISDGSMTASPLSDPLAAVLSSDVHNIIEADSGQLWMKDYQSCLQSHILDIEKEDQLEWSNQTEPSRGNKSQSLSADNRRGSSVAAAQRMNSFSDAETQTAPEGILSPLDILGDVAAVQASQPLPTHPSQIPGSKHRQNPTVFNSISATIPSPANPLPSSIRSPLLLEFENFTSFEGFRDKQDSINVGESQQSDDIDFSALLDAGNRALQPVLFPTYNGSLDWMMPDPAGDGVPEEW